MIEKFLARSRCRCGDDDAFAMRADFSMPFSSVRRYSTPRARNETFFSSSAFPEEIEELRNEKHETV